MLVAILPLGPDGVWINPNASSRGMTAERTSFEYIMHPNSNLPTKRFGYRIGSQHLGASFSVELLDSTGRIVSRWNRVDIEAGKTERWGATLSPETYQRLVVGENYTFRVIGTINGNSQANHWNFTFTHRPPSNFR
jgi:hypothetical protein